MHGRLAQKWGRDVSTPIFQTASESGAPTLTENRQRAAISAPASLLAIINHALFCPAAVHGTLGLRRSGGYGSLAARSRSILVRRQPVSVANLFQARIGVMRRQAVHHQGLRFHEKLSQMAVT